MTVDDGYDTVEDHGRSGGQGLGGNRTDCEPAMKDGSKAHADTAATSRCGMDAAEHSRSSDFGRSARGSPD